MIQTENKLDKYFGDSTPSIQWLKSVEKIHHIALTDWGLKVRESIEALIKHITWESFLTIHHKRVWQCIPIEFLRLFKIVDESWIRHNSLKTKQKKRTIKVEYYVVFLYRFNADLKKKPTEFGEGNGRMHMCVGAIRKFNELGYKLPYSSQSAPNGYSP